MHVSALHLAARRGATGNAIAVGHISQGSWRRSSSAARRALCSAGWPAWRLANGAPDSWHGHSSSGG
eukprot:8506853-Alexandrium_andersonii.AAC.1